MTPRGRQWNIPRQDVRRARLVGQCRTCHRSGMTAIPVPRPNPRLSDAQTNWRGLRLLPATTPLRAVDCEVHGRRRTVFAKAENLNFTGSIKDRMAIHIIRHAYECGQLEPGGLIIEATSGNTGISFAAIGRAPG